MSILRLPHDVLVNIAFYLPVTQCRELSMVCKAWNDPFLERVWSSIKITTEEEAKAVYSFLLDTSSPIQPHLNHVYNLLINGDVILSEQMFTSLQDSFRAINYLEIKSNTFHRYSQFPYIKWKNWDSLGILYFHVLSKDFGIDDALCTLYYLKNLHELNIGSKDNICKHSITWIQLDDLHQSLPKLKTLLLNLDIELICIKDFEAISKSDVYNDMTSFSYYGKPFTVSWLYFWAKKYPNLHEFFNICRPVETARCENTMTVLDEVLKLKNPLKYLRTASFRCRPRGGIIDSSFLQILFLTSKRLTRVNTIISTREGDISDTKSVIKALMQSHKTLSKLTLEIKEYSLHPTFFTKSFRACPLLVDVEIKSNGATFKIDKLLDYFPALIELRLEIRKLCISKNAHRLPSNHPLRYIQVKNCEFEAALFSYLSRRCYYMDVLSMSRILITNLPPTCPGYIYIDMPFNSFKLVEFNHVYLCGVKDNTDYTNRDVLLNITQLYDQRHRIDTLTDRTVKIKGTEIYKGQVVATNKARIYWEKVEARDINRCTGIFKSLEAGLRAPTYRQRSRRWLNILTCSLGCGGSLEIESIPMNYIKLRCETIKNFEITYKTLV